MFESPKIRFKSKSHIPIRALICPVIADRYYNVWTPELDPSTGRHNVSSRGHFSVANPRLPEAKTMNYRNFSFGKGITNDVQLDLFGHCNYISPKHAVIYYDEIEHSYQLLNYSCYGTYVDNALAANNETCKYVREEEIEELKSIKTSHLKKYPRKTFIPCQCMSSNFEGLTTGWEGSLLVSHGSVLRFGCTSFVFTVVDHSLITPCSISEWVETI